MLISPPDRPLRKINVKTKTKKLNMPNHQISVSRKGFSKLFKHCRAGSVQRKTRKTGEKREKTNYTALKTLTTSAVAILTRVLRFRGSGGDRHNRIAIKREIFECKHNLHPSRMRVCGLWQWRRRRLQSVFRGVACHTRNSQAASRDTFVSLSSPKRGEPQPNVNVCLAHPSGDGCKCIRRERERECECERVESKLQLRATKSRLAT